MKKALSLILALVLCLSLCACGGNSIKKACKEADELVSKWHSEGTSGCIFKGEYIAEHDGYEVSMYMVSVRYSSEVDAMDRGAAFVKNSIASTLRDELHPQLAEIFEGTDVAVGFILSDQSGNNTWCTILDGEIEYYN